MLIRLLLLTLAIFSVTAISVEANSPSSPRVELDDLMSPAEILEELEQEVDLFSANPTSAEVRLRILVDKSQQRLWVEEDGQITHSWLISSGSELEKCAPTKCYVATTPAGEYVPFRMHEKYTSKLWDARMDYAIFFNGGIALHATYGENVAKLGTRQSGGCIRQKEENASFLFSLVNYYGMESTRVIVAENFGLYDQPSTRPPLDIRPKKVEEKKKNCFLLDNLFKKKGCSF
jgi:lipoprotein-anchoring transpeptidase ErfK/SrfK